MFIKINYRNFLSSPTKTQTHEENIKRFNLIGSYDFIGISSAKGRN